MASSPLTKHGIAVIFGDHKTHPAYQQPIVQILNTKKISAQASSANGAAASVPEKYRLILSDGEQYCQGVLATQMNHLMHAEEIVKNSIVKLNKFVFNNVAADRKYLFSSLIIHDNPEDLLCIFIKGGDHSGRLCYSDARRKDWRPSERRNDTVATDRARRDYSISGDGVCSTHHGTDECIDRCGATGYESVASGREPVSATPVRVQRCSVVFC